MFLNFFLENVWFAIGLWVILYSLDYFFTLRAARLYQAGVNKHFVFGGGYELNPVFQKDIAALRRFSLRFVLLLLLVVVILFVLHAINFPEGFGFCLGVLIGVQLAIHMRHLRNLAVFGYAQKSIGINGRIEYEHWLSLRLSALELFAFSGLYLVLFLLVGSFFILGGMVGCFSVAWRHLLDSTKHKNAKRVQ